MSGDCVICSIVAGVEPSRLVMESESAIAFLVMHPAADGHTLVAPKQHYRDIWALDDDAAADVWALAVHVAHRLRDVLAPDGLTLFQANGAAGWQDVFHFHLHLVPRWQGDSLIEPWQETLGDPERLDAIGARLRGGEDDADT